jgi:hypothetical protein
MDQKLPQFDPWMLKLRDARKDETTGHNLLQVDVNVIPSHGVVVCNSQARN